MKSSVQIKQQLEHWFLKHIAKERHEMGGTERFTLFDAIQASKTAYWLERISLRKGELLVLVLRVSESQIIINSTERFFYLTPFTIEQVEYTNFEGHNGFTQPAVRDTTTGKNTSVKTEGKTAPFELRMLNGDTLLWNVPTGVSGFAFWNVTKKCELIGRKYLGGNSLKNEGT